MVLSQRDLAIKMIIAGTLTYTLVNRYFPTNKNKLKDSYEPSLKLPSKDDGNPSPIISKRLRFRGGASELAKHVLTYFLKTMTDDKGLKAALLVMLGVYCQTTFMDKLIEVIRGASNYSYLPGEKDKIVVSMRNLKDGFEGVTSKKVIELLSENHKFTRAEKLAYLKLYIKSLLSWKNLKTKKSSILLILTLLVLTAVFGIIPYGALIAALAKFLTSGKLDQDVREYIMELFLVEGIPLPPELIDLLSNATRSN